MNTYTKSKRVYPLFIVVLILIAVVLTIAVTWSRKNENASRTQSQNAPLEKDDQNNNSDKSLNSCEDNAGPDSHSMVYYCIPEMGIRFKVNEKLESDLVYSYEQGEQILGGEKASVVNVSTKSLMKISEYCNVNEFPLGKIARLEGISPNYEFDYSKTEMFRQFSNFFVFYIHPQVPCTEKQTLFKQLLSPQLEEFEKSLRTVEMMD